MPNKASILDQFTQWCLLRIGFTAAAAATVVQRLETGITTLQKMAWEVYAIDYWWPYAAFSAARFNAIGYFASLGITQSSNVTQAVALNNASLVDLDSFGRTDVVATGLQHFWMPRRKEFKDPILILPSNLYVILSWSTAGAMSASDVCEIRIHYKEKELGPEDWYDLLQLRLPLGAT
jgi:hypothetical protein